MAAFFCSEIYTQGRIVEEESEQATFLLGRKYCDGEDFVNPWFVATLKDLLQRMNSQVVKYEMQLKPTFGTLIREDVYYCVSDLSAGQGGLAQVFKAYLNSNPDDVVALKIQKPPFPWEFYMYRQLDMRIPKNERKSFGFAHRLYLYFDYRYGKEDKNMCRR
ncbi:hypothetical protein OROMI_009100 [Orobanche minor]